MTIPGALDLRLTLGHLWRGPWDPTMTLAPARVRRATRTPSGPAVLELGARPGGGRTLVTARAWGPGAGAALAALPALIGAGDHPVALPPAHPLVTRLARSLPGLRLGRTGAVFEALVPAIVEQKVSGKEAWRSYRALTLALSEPAPGPGGLYLPPAPAAFAGLGYFELHRFGIERRRAATLLRAAAQAPALEAAAARGPQALHARLRAVPGVGPWTAAEVCHRALGDPDAVPLGDYHLPHVVAWALAGRARADDACMLELLAPYAGQRARVLRLLEAAGIRPPVIGPRRRLRSIRGL